MTHVMILMLRCAAIFYGITSLTACTLAQDSSTSFVDRLDLEVPALLEKHQEPGIAVAFVDRWKGSIRTYGLANREAAVPVRADTVFNLGSISKTFTAWTVMTLVEAGKVKLDDPADTYLKRWHLPESTFDPHAVTVRRLLNHTAGISIPSVSGVDRGAPVPSLIDELNGRGPAMPYLGDGSPYRLREFSASGAAGLVSTAQDMGAFLLAHCAGANTRANTAVLKPRRSSRCGRREYPLRDLVGGAGHHKYRGSITCGAVSAGSLFEDRATDSAIQSFPDQVRSSTSRVTAVRTSAGKPS